MEEEGASETRVDDNGWTDSMPMMTLPQGALEEQGQRQGGCSRPKRARSGEIEQTLTEDEGNVLSSSGALPGTVPAYVLRYASSSVQEAWTSAFTAMQSGAHAMLQAERSRAEEAVLRCGRLEKAVLELGREKVDFLFCANHYRMMIAVFDSFFLHRLLN